MPAPRKYFRNNDVLFVTCSLEQGLLLLANPLARSIIAGCLSRAKALYPVRLSHFLVNGNHIHMLLTVINPTDTSNFLGYFKAETAHRFNILMGWKKRTIWCEGYDSPVVLSPLRALMALAYLYANPAKDNLVDSVEKFPGFSSWKMYTKQDLKRTFAYPRRTRFRQLPPQAHCPSGYDREASRLINSTTELYQFELEPNAWLHSFGIKEDSEIKKWNSLLVKRVRLLERRAREKRKKLNKTIIGDARLKSQVFTFNYKSKRNGKRMWCLSEKRSIRQAFIAEVKYAIKLSRAVRKRWQVGDYSVSYPPGLFPPNQPKLCECLKPLLL